MSSDRADFILHIEEGVTVTHAMCGVHKSTNVCVRVDYYQEWAGWGKRWCKNCKRAYLRQYKSSGDKKLAEEI